MTPEENEIKYDAIWRTTKVINTLEDLLREAKTVKTTIENDSLPSKEKAEMLHRLLQLCIEASFNMNLEQLAKSYSQYDSFSSR